MKPLWNSEIINCFATALGMVLGFVATGAAYGETIESTRHGASSYTTNARKAYEDIQIKTAQLKLSCFDDGGQISICNRKVRVFSGSASATASAQVECIVAPRENNSFLYSMPFAYPSFISTISEASDYAICTGYITMRNETAFCVENLNFQFLGSIIQPECL